MLIVKKGPISPKKINYEGATYKRVRSYTNDNHKAVEVYEYEHQFHEPYYLVKTEDGIAELNKEELEHYLKYKFGGIKHVI